MQRIILHIDLDAFFVEVERLNDPSLFGKPVIVGGSPDGKRGVVSTASYEARVFGVHSAMPIVTAKKLCPHGVYVRVGTSDYGSYSKQVREILQKYSPLVQMNSIDEAYLDLTGTEKLLGHPLEAAQRMHDEIWEQTKLPNSIGLGANKLVAKVLSDAAKPHGMLFVYPGMEKHYFAHLDVRKLPGIGKRFEPELLKHGLKKLGDIQKAGIDYLHSLFGERLAKELMARACGKSKSEVLPSHDAKSISNERTFEEDITNLDQLEVHLSFLAEKVGQRLREQHLAAKTLQLKLRYSDFKTITRSTTFNEGVQSDREFFQAAKKMLEKSFHTDSKIRLIGIGVSNLTDSHWQLDFLEEDKHDKDDKLSKAVDQIKDRYGFKSILWAQSKKKE